MNSRKAASSAAGILSRLKRGGLVERQSAQIWTLKSCEFLALAEEANTRESPEKTIAPLDSTTYTLLVSTSQTQLEHVLMLIFRCWGLVGVDLALWILVQSCAFLALPKFLGQEKVKKGYWKSYRLFAWGCMYAPVPAPSKLFVLTVLRAPFSLVPHLHTIC